MKKFIVNDATGFIGTGDQPWANAKSKGVLNDDNSIGNIDEEFEEEEDDDPALVAMTEIYRDHPAKHPEQFDKGDDPQAEEGAFPQREYVDENEPDYQMQSYTRNDEDDESLKCMTAPFTDRNYQP